MKQLIKQVVTDWPISIIWKEYTNPTSPGVNLQKPMGIKNDTTRCPQFPILKLAAIHYGW